MKTSLLLLPVALLMLLVWGGIIYLFYLLVRALRAYIKSTEVRREKAEIKRSLGETLRSHRTACGMTQEFVAEAIGVTRQAVSKWESGASDPSTSNLLALAKLYGISGETLLQEIAPKGND